jgi:hypothetical protein
MTRGKASGETVLKMIAELPTDTQWMETSNMHESAVQAVQRVFQKFRWVHEDANIFALEVLQDPSYAKLLFALDRAIANRVGESCDCHEHGVLTETSVKREPEKVAPRATVRNLEVLFADNHGLKVGRLYTKVKEVLDTLLPVASVTLRDTIVRVEYR